MYSWLSDLLFHRTARVKIDGAVSKLVKMKEGVTTGGGGGGISPTLFLVFINDITTTVHVPNTLHADAVAVWSSSEHTSTATYRIQNTANRVSDWTRQGAL